MENITITINTKNRCFNEGEVVSLNLEPNKVNYIVGPNACGKTTLLHYIRVTKNSLHDLNMKAFDGMEPDDDRLYRNSSAITIEGLEQFDAVYVLDSVDDDPTSFINSASANGFISGGGLCSMSLSKGQKVKQMIGRFLDKMQKHSGFGIDKYRAGETYSGHPLIMVDEVDEGLDLASQVTFHKLINNIGRVWNATVICVCHNVLAMVSNGDLNTPVYDLSTKSNKSIHDYIKEQTGLSISVNK